MGRSSARLTYRDLKLVLLAVLDQQGRSPRAALTGGKQQAGLVEAALERPLLQRDRVRVEEALDLLLRDGLVSCSQGGAFALTSQGREALARSCLDPLDIALHRISPLLVESRARAWAAVAAGTADALRAAATAPRSIVVACLNHVEDPERLDEVAEQAADLVLLLDERIQARLDEDRPPKAQDLADAIRVTETVVRRTLLLAWQ